MRPLIFPKSVVFSDHTIYMVHGRREPGKKRFGHIRLSMPIKYVQTDLADFMVSIPRMNSVNP